MNLDTEIRNGYEISSQMKKVWAIQLDMVAHVLDVCKRHDLNIWAEGGTLLGAVREHGYIPWDDDIDLMMLRDDYDRLVSIAMEEFKSPYFFQCAYTEKKYYRGHAQIRYDNTCMILPGDIFQKFNQGIFIDIFVYDSVPDVMDINWEAKLQRADEISKILNDSSYSRVISKTPISSIIKKLKVSFGKDLALFKEYEDLFRSNSWSENKRIACPCFNRKIIERYTREKQWYRDTIYLPFEDMTLPVPAGYDDVLRTQYGEYYMTPRKAPSMHGGFLALDTKKPYQDYLKPLRREENKKRINRNVLNIKELFHL